MSWFKITGFSNTEEYFSIKLFSAIAFILFFFLSFPLAFGTITSVSLSAPVNNTNTSVTQPNFNFTAISDINSTFSCELFVGGTGYGKNTSTYNNTLTTIQANASISDGIYNWYVNCTDVNGTTQSEVRTITIDTTAPAISLNSPANAYNSSSASVNFTFTSTDNLASAVSCELIIDGVVNQTNSSVLNNTATVFSVSGLSEGSHNWKVNCTDDANNEGSEAQRTLIVDTISPISMINSPTSNRHINTRTITINITATDANLNYTNISIINSTGQIANSTTNSTNGTYTVILLVPRDGIYNITIASYDFAGNGNSTTHTNITIDTTSPTITSFTLSTKQVYLGGTITGKCSASDNLGGSVSVSISGIDTSTAGTKTATCTATDYTGNTATAHVSYIVIFPGGGGSYTSLSLKQVHSWNKIIPGAAVIMKITKKDIGLEQIEISVKNKVNNVKITVTKLNNKPASVKDIKGKVLKYLKITPENLPETDLKKAVIQFRVPKNWITKNNLNKDTVYLYRFANNEWQKLKTNLINETKDYANYEAETPGFSYFAIGGEEKICEELQKRCVSTNLEQCLNNSWQLLKKCDYGCNSTTLSCNPKPVKKTAVVEGERRCSNNILQEYKHGIWTTLKSCEFGCNKTTLTCNSKPKLKGSEKTYYTIYAIIVAVILAVFLFVISKKAGKKKKTK